MKNALRFLVRFHWPVVVSFLIYGGVMTAYAATGGTRSDGILTTYYYLFPLVPALFLSIFQFGSGTAYLSMALSMGCTRRAYFGANQVLMVLSVLVNWALTALFLFLPQWLGWQGVEPFMPAAALPLLPLVTLAVGECSSAAGLLRREHAALGVICYGVAFVALMCLAVLVQVVKQAWLWGDLPAILLSVSVILGALCLIVEVQQTRQAVVR